MSFLLYLYCYMGLGAGGVPKNVERPDRGSERYSDGEVGKNESNHVQA